MERSSPYLRGAFWFILVSMISASNDTLVKLLGTRLSPIEVAFFRFFFSMMTLLPFMMAQGRKAFVTSHWKIHGVRSLLLFLALAPWCYGVIKLPLTLVTTLSFTTPLFVLVLSSIFLKEKVGGHRIFATILGFSGILLSAQPKVSGLNLTVFVLVASTCMFATLDILNKKLLIKNESLLSMLFFSALGTTLLSFPFVIFDLQMPHLHEAFFLLILGGGAKLIIFCLLKAFESVDLSFLQPFRYLELLFTAALGWFCFREIPETYTLLGALFIIPSTLYIACYETWRSRRLNVKPLVCSSVS